MELVLIRNSHTAHSVIGQLYVIKNNGSREKICFTLEDARRRPGIKIKGETCIPAGRYCLAVSRSARFKRKMVMLYNCANGYELKGEGVSFKGIRIHGGNTARNTEGCLLVAYNRIDDDTIQGTAEKEVTELVDDALDRGESAWIEIFD